MGNVTPTATPQPYQRLRLFAFIVLATTVILWARFYFANLHVTADSTSEADVASVAEQSQPLLDALEKYHADHNLYPATLDQLTPVYLPSMPTLHGFRYSARHSDWVFESDACLARDKSLHGWILQEVKASQKEVSQFKRECVAGYHDYQLQSRDFPFDPGSRSVKRWAYYDSQPRQWSLGWCEKVTTSRGLQELATNGVCRGRD